jgi:hypothetical protein
MKTYWLEATAPDLNRRSAAASSSGGSEDIGSDGSYNRSSPAGFEDQNQGLVEWNFTIMKTALLDVVKYRKTRPSHPTDDMRKLEEQFLIDHTYTSLQEVREIVCLPKFDEDVAAADVVGTDLSDDVMQQLRAYIHTLSTLYEDNPFHNFQHATHVTMSVVKLLSRIVNSGGVVNGRETHDYTYGITSDPITQFAVILTALIHDVGTLFFQLELLCSSISCASNSTIPHFLFPSYLPPFSIVYRPSRCNECTIGEGG